MLKKKCEGNIYFDIFRDYLKTAYISNYICQLKSRTQKAPSGQVGNSRFKIFITKRKRGGNNKQ